MKYSLIRINLFAWRDSSTLQRFGDLIFPMKRLRVVRFDKTRTRDFFSVHSSANGADWCYCTAWWMPTWEDWGNRSAEDNLYLRQDLLTKGEYDGYLLYIDDQPVGWCQVGPRDRLWKLTDQFHLKPDPRTWAITCFLIAPNYRSQGLADKLLKEVVSDLIDQGVRRIEAFPKRGPDLDEFELWNGPEEMYKRAGFEIERDDPNRPVLSLTIK